MQCQVESSSKFRKKFLANPFKEFSSSRYAIKKGMLHVCFPLFTSARALANIFVLASLPKWHANDPDTILHRIAEDTFFPCADIRPPRNP